MENGMVEGKGSVGKEYESGACGRVMKGGKEVKGIRSE